MDVIINYSINVKGPIILDWYFVHFLTVRATAIANNIYIKPSYFDSLPYLVLIHPAVAFLVVFLMSSMSLYLLKCSRNFPVHSSRISTDL